MNIKHLIPALLCAAGMAQALSPVETYGSLAVSGNKLVDSAGKAVILRGMSLFWHYDKGGKEFWTPSAMAYTMTDWHASVIRAPIGVDDRTISSGTIKGYINNPTDANTKIHTAIDAAILKGFYVVVDWHTEQLHEAEAKTFFGALAKEYGNTPNIIWEIYNEPNGPGWSQIASYAKNVITEIRKYSDNVVLVGNSSWDQHPDEAGTELNGFNNIAYTVHFYSDHTHWGTIDAAMTGDGHAVFASEWGMSGSSGNGSFQNTSTGNIATWLSKLESSGVSSCNWSLGNPLENAGAGPNPETSAALGLTAAYAPSAATPWNDADLTASGLSIRAYLRSKNPAWTLADTSTKLVSALKITSTKTTGFTYGKDTISFSAGYNKATSWTLTETGRTSKALYSTAGVTSAVAAEHLIGKKNAGSAAWQNETIDVLLMPLNKTLSYTITGVTVGVTRIRQLHEKDIVWEGSRLFIGSDIIDEGASVSVRLRDAQGRVVWARQATMGVYGRVELSAARPDIPGVLFLDVNSEDAVVRARLAPKL